MDNVFWQVSTLHHSVKILTAIDNITFIDTVIGNRVFVLSIQNTESSSFIRCMYDRDNVLYNVKKRGKKSEFDLFISGGIQLQSTKGNLVATVLVASWKLNVL